jgi:hypothetical protein
LQDVGCLDEAKPIGEFLVSSVVNCLGNNYLNYDLFNEVASSFVRATLDYNFKIKILSTCTEQVEELIVKAITRLKPAPVEAEDRLCVIDLLDNMCSFCLFFILSEKNRFDPHHKSDVQELHPLLSKLPIRIARHLFLSSTETNPGAVQALKIFLLLWNGNEPYTKSKLVSQNFFVEIDGACNNKIPFDIVKCLVCLNDEQTWQLFSQAMCRHTYQNNPIVRVLSKNVVTPNAIVDSTLFLCIRNHHMDNWIKQLTNIKEPYSSDLNSSS